MISPGDLLRVTEQFHYIYYLEKNTFYQELKVKDPLLIVKEIEDRNGWYVVVQGNKIGQVYGSAFSDCR